MGAYNRTNGEPCCASPTLLDKILRREWGFAGYVVSDCGAIRDIFMHHQVVATAEEAAAMAVRAGCDLECGNIYSALRQAVEQGLISTEAIDQAVKRLFTARFRLGMFDPPEQVPYAQIPFEVNDSPQHRALARRAAQESIVLLKNEGNLLPLRRNLKSIAVIGPNADNSLALLGNYNGTPSKAITPLEGIRQKVAPATRIYYAHGCEIASGVPPLSVIPSAHLRPAEADGSQTGLTAAYYTNTSLAGKPAFVRVDPTVDFVWKATSPFGGYPTDEFSVCWTGSLIPPVSGIYRLGTNGATDYKLYVDGKPLIEYHSIHHPNIKTLEIELEAGRLYSLRLEYVNQGLDPQMQLLWAPPGRNYMAEAIEAAQKAQVIIMALGLTPTLEGEEMPVNVEGFIGGDRTDIKLPAPQEKLLKKIHALGKPIVLVLLNGSALAIKWANDHVPAILEAWYPGEEGGAAIADVLFGDYNPAGRLPVTFYKSVDQLPPFEDYAMAGRTYRYMTQRPLYPFGYGLSYTRFKYSNLRIDPPQIDAAGQALVSLDVKNIGKRAGDEVVQLYVCYPNSQVPRPLKDLRGFARITLAPGETKSVTFTLAARQLAYWEHGKWIVEPGIVQVMVGSSSEDIRLTGQLVIR